MGKLQVFLFISFLEHLVSSQLMIEEQDPIFPPNLSDFFEGILHFPFNLFPDNTFLRSWQIPIPNFHWINEVPTFSGIPRVEVRCDKSHLTLFVEKSFNGELLDGTQMQLGTGCYSNGELPNRFIFTYRSDECGTKHEVQNDMDVLSNTFYFNLPKSSFTRWHPSSVHISCATKRSDDDLSFLVSDAPHENGRSFNIKLMNPSWTSTAKSDIFKKGQIVHIQVSANTRPDEHLFVQSCFVSASPMPHTKPKHAIIMNKGCAVPLDSSYAMAQFVDSNKEDVVNLVLNTSFITSKFYIHCSVVVSKHSNTYGSKSCNFNFIQFRWEDLSGNADVCKCCSSKCKGLSLKHLPHDAIAIVSAGPLLIEDDDDEITSSIHEADSLQSSSAETGDMIISGASFTNGLSDSSQLFSPESVVNQGQVIRQALWSPGETQDTEHYKIDSEDDWTAELQQSDMESNHILDLSPLSAAQEISLNALSNEIKYGNEQGDALPWVVNALMLFNGQPIPAHLEEVAMEEESQRKRRFENIEALPLPWEVNTHNMRLAQKRNERNDVQPVIRSKVEFSKSVDGSQTWSYEQEIIQEEEGMGETRHVRMHGLNQRPLVSSFLDLLRRMGQAE